MDPRQQQQQQLHAGDGAKDGRKQSFAKGARAAGRGAGGSIRSRTTAGLTTFEDDLDTGFATGGGGSGGKPTHSRLHGSSASHVGLSQEQQHGMQSPFKDAPDYEDSEFSDDDEDDNETMGSMMSGESPGGSFSGAPDSAAGEIWRMLCSLDNLVLEVKVGVSKRTRSSHKACRSEERERERGRSDLYAPFMFACFILLVR